MDLDRFKRRLAVRLLAWSLLSIVAGTALVNSRLEASWKAFGLQAIGWGTVDLALALWGLWRAGHGGESVQNAESLQRLLRVNAALDIVYVSVGLVLAVWLGPRRQAMVGHGWGIVAQGSFLLLFDWVHANRVPFKSGLDRLGAFGTEEHLPFLWEGGKPAVLLVHGFPGTPAEMRPLGEVLRNEGWTVQGILLPGLGREIHTLAQYRYVDWVAAVRQAMAALRERHQPLLLVGYSIGGALAIAAAAADAPDAVALIAPFTWKESAWRQAMRRVLRPLLPLYVQPFAWLRLDDERTRAFVHSLLPTIDLDDAAVRTSLRQTRVDTVILEQVLEAGRNALLRAGSIAVPTLIIAGADDPVVSAASLRTLASQLGGNPRVTEVAGDHDLTRVDHPSWGEVSSEVVAWAREVSGKSAG